MMLIDSHCHLDFPELAERIDEVLATASAAGIVQMVTISTRIRRFETVRTIAERYDNVFCSVGTHPHNADEEADIGVDEIVALSKHPKVVAIGESGLDYYYDNSPRELQRAAFRRHIEAARRTGLPLVVHTRDADDDTIEILRDEAKKGPFPGLIHCFTASPRLAYAAMDLGLYISLSGVITFKKATQLQDTVSELPLERLLVETDAPFLAPVPHRGQTNEPAFTRHTAEKLADLKQVPLERIAAATSDNFYRLFGKVPRAAERTTAS